MTIACRRHGRSGMLPTAALLAMAAAPVPAANVTNALTLSSEVLGIGGVDIACLQNTAAVVVNPANLAFIDMARMDLVPGVTEPGSIRHTDSFGSSQPNTVSYTNTNALFGTAVEEKFSLWHLMATLTYVWEN